MLSIVVSKPWRDVFYKQSVPTTYEDLVDKVEQTTFTQAMVDKPLPTKFHTPTFIKMMVQPTRMSTYANIDKS